MNSAPTNSSADHPNVLVHPPLFYLSALIVSSVLHWFYPLPIFASMMPRLLGLPLVIAGLSIIATGRRLMESHGTNIRPTKPTTAIIQTGIYRYSRNPLYLSLTLTYCGLALLINTWWAFLFLPLVLLPMHFFVVLREERYLENKFGDAYREYRARVRRYL